MLAGKDKTNTLLIVFGFPASPQIALEQRNLGFMDQRQALTWVTKNIRAFGGDPSKVTVFGESSGGYSVKQLLANPPSPLQFRAAIMQSQALGDQGDGDKSWAALADDLGCNSTTSGISQLECMRSSPADQIRAILNSGTLGFPPAVDNKTNNGNFEAAINAHTVANVPILLGTNADEGTVLTSVMPDSQILLQNFLGNDTHSQALARAAYPHDATEKELKSRIVTDYLYTCTTSAIANVLNDANYKVWRYYFNASFPNTQPFPGAGAWHTSEISLVFGTYPRNYMTTPQQIELSKFMQHSWASFAKDPERGPGWTMIEGGKEDLQVIGANGTSWGQPASIESVEDICSVYSPAIRIGGL
ncbi:hypothetical protein PCG10_007565 [Penicillium crustosum]|uniref:Carboxylic ester hydrolase n=1 Tax=Penicillium crustosum TaxID=36656 RepID=A0A9P5GK18_PENCR|nr:hypothetical protein PCG10_007565 [Penicillium crustosum]